jgi:hypothetical protein
MLFCASAAMQDKPNIKLAKARRADAKGPFLPGRPGGNAAVVLTNGEQPFLVTTVANGPKQVIAP